MMPISGVNTGAVQPLTTAEKVQGASQVQEPEEEVQGRQRKPVMDEFVRSEPFDMERAEPEKKGSEGERWSCDTGRVDREIEKLKKQQQELEQRLNAETDEAKRKDLERQLAQVERELKQKDSDAYRRQHAVYTRLS